MTEEQFKVAALQFVRTVEETNELGTWFGDSGPTGHQVDGYVDYLAALREFAETVTAPVRAQLERVVDATGYDGETL